MSFCKVLLSGSRHTSQRSQAVLFFSMFTHTSTYIYTLLYVIGENLKKNCLLLAGLVCGYQKNSIDDDALCVILLILSEDCRTILSQVTATQHAV